MADFARDALVLGALAVVFLGGVYFGRLLECLKRGSNGALPQKVYDSEINASISWFWDAGFTVKLGDTLNGFTDERECLNWREVEEWFDRTVRERYPNSEYARRVG